uniref:Poly(A) polymerase nucleotidyltransferase domain-containing protein n=1 Tax=Glossina pallidipes TaxID=7398 RepID=A0A1B0A6U7_GLOPL
MTSAISLASPKPEDLQKTEELRKALEPYKVFESEEELNHRMELLAKLNTLVKQWVKDVSIAKNKPEAAAEKLGDKIYTFGSYRLGVHHKGADIDALCVGPPIFEFDIRRLCYNGYNCFNKNATTTTPNIPLAFSKL